MELRKEQVAERICRCWIVYLVGVALIATAAPLDTDPLRWMLPESSAASQHIHQVQRRAAEINDNVVSVDNQISTNQRITRKAPILNLLKQWSKRLPQVCNSVIGFCFFSLPRASKLITDFHFVELRCGLVTEADPLDRSDSPAIDRSLQKRLMQLRWNSNFPKALSVDLWRPLLSIPGFRRKPWVLCRVAIGLSLSSRFSVLKHKNLITCFRLDRRKKSHLMDSFRGLLLSNTKHSAHRQSTFPSSALVCQNDQFDGIWPIFLI